MKVSTLISEVQNEFADTLTLTPAHLYAIYNVCAPALALKLPANAVMTASDSDFVVTSALSASQVERVFCGGRELVRVSRGVYDALNEKSLYAVEDGKIYTGLHGSFKISYRALPAAVSAANAASADIPFPPTGIACLRTAMLRAVYLSLGDVEAADACLAEEERLFAALRAELGGAHR